MLNDFLTREIKISLSPENYLVLNQLTEKVMTSIDVKMRQSTPSVNHDSVELNDSVSVMVKNKCRCWAT